MLRTLHWIVTAWLVAGCAQPGAVAQGSIASTGVDAVADAGHQADGSAPGLDAPDPPADTCSSSDAALRLPRACPDEPPRWHTAQSKATLAVDVGRYDVAEGAFHPWSDGQWAAMHTGMRTGYGVWAAVRVQLPGETAPEVSLQVDVDGLVGCEVKGETVTKKMTFQPIPGEPGAYVNASATHPGACILVQEPWSRATELCGQWFTIRARVGSLDGSAWGETVRSVRLYGFESWPYP